MDHGKPDPGFTALGGLLIVLRQTTTLHQPTERALHHPATRKDDKAFDIVRALDDLQRPTRHQGGNPSNQLPRIAAVRPEKAQSRELAQQARQDQPGAIAVLDTRAMNHHAQQQAQGIYRDVALAAFDFLAGVVAVVPPFCVVLTDWESTMAALGVASRPARLRTFSRNAS